MFIRKHLTVFVILILFSLCACSAKTEEVLPEIVIGYSNYRPYCYTDENGDLAGIDVEFAREACRRTGYTPVFKLSGWRNRDYLLESGDIDLFWCCVPMESESDSSVLVGPYMYSRQVVAVLKNSPIQTLDDLAERRSPCVSPPLRSRYSCIRQIPMFRSLKMCTALTTQRLW